jgi:hypothetical protein
MFFSPSIRAALYSFSMSPNEESSGAVFESMVIVPRQIPVVGRTVQLLNVVSDLNNLDFENSDINVSSEYALNILF